MLTILAVGEDFDLLKTRAEILRRTGANVLCSSGAAAMKFIDEWEFDVIVLGHSVGEQDAIRITEATHWPGSKTLVLLLVAGETQEPAFEGLNVDSRSFVEPACLLRSVAQLLERQQGPRPSEAVFKRPTNSPLFKKKPASLPADITLRQRQITQLQGRRAG